MTIYRMPLVEVLLGNRREFRPKYGHMIPLQFPWSLIKENNKQWDQVVKENGKVLLETKRELPVDIHLQIVSMRDVEIVSR